MGCGASAGGHASPPEPPAQPKDPFEEAMEKIRNELRPNLKELLPTLKKEKEEERYVKSTALKLDIVIQEMHEDTADEQDTHDGIMRHIAKRDALDINEASVGLGTDEDKMAKVILERDHENVVITDEIYQEMYGRTLEDQVRGENKSILGLLTGSLTHFGRFLTYRCMDPAKRDAFLLHKAMAGMGCSDYILIEILSTRTNAELQAAAAAYAEDQNGEDLVERIMKETGGFGKKWYGKWIDTLVEFDRDESGEVDGDPEELAQQLYKAGAGKWMGCDEQVFIDILCKASEQTCEAIAAAYEELDETKNDLATDVEKKMGGDLEFAVLARVRPKAEFLVRRIYKACKGWGTDEECLGRVLACMTKKDAKEFRDAYNEYYAEEKEPYNSLEHLLASELSGSFLQALLNFIATVPPKGHEEPISTYAPQAEEAATEFRDQVSEAYNDGAAAYLGAGELLGGVQLCGIDEPFLETEGEYGFAIAPLPQWQDKDRAEFFDQDPSDLDGAQALIRKLVREIQVTQSEIESLRSVMDNLVEGLYQTKAEEMRRSEHFLIRLRADNDQMTEFSAQRDADAVREATEGWGTDENKLITVLCSLTKRQLRRVDQIYEERYGKSLRETTDGELGGFFEGSFKYYMKCLLTAPEKLDAELLVEAMRGLGTNDALLCELVCTRTTKELKKACDEFQKEQGKSVFQWVQGDTSGNYETFLLSCLKADRAEGDDADEALAKKQAKQLWESGLGGGDADHAAIRSVLCAASEAQCQAIRRCFQEEQGVALTQAIKEKMSGDLERALLARVLDKSTYYAQRLHDSMAGLGTDENGLSRILGRCRKKEILEVEKRYEELYGKTLHDMIKSECSGNFKKALLQSVYGEVAADGAPAEEE